MDWIRWIILIVLAAAVFVLMQWGKKRGETTRSTRLMKQYETLTREKLAAANEGELVEAVAAHILAQADKSRRPDPVAVLGTMEYGPAVVYPVWVICREMAGGDFAALMESDSRELVELAQNGFSRLGAAGCAQALDRLRQAYPEAGAWEPEQEAFRQAVLAEQPLALCEDYIRDNMDEFVEE